MQAQSCVCVSLKGGQKAPPWPIAIFKLTPDILSKSQFNAKYSLLRWSVQKSTPGSWEKKSPE